MAAYIEKFPVGSQVRVADAQSLQEFQLTWKYHNRIQDDQLNYAGMVAEVETVGFYHGGDVIYRLRGIPGLWHQQCLFPTSQS